MPAQCACQWDCECRPIKGPVPSTLVTEDRDTHYDGVIKFISTPEEKLVSDVSGTPTLYLGLELELHFPRGFNYNETRLFGESHWFVERGYHDVSIEFPFRPLTIGAYRASVDDIAAFLKALRDMGAKSHNGELCGQHIHMSRNAFVGDHLYRMVDFIYRHERFSTALSQRTDEQVDLYCEYDGNYRRGDERDNYYRQKVMGNSGGAMRLRPDTAELRLPRGTVRLDRFYKNLEWAQSAFEFSREAEYSDRNPDEYYRWLKTRGVFPNLVSFIEEKRLVEAARPAVAV